MENRPKLDGGKNGKKMAQKWIFEGVFHYFSNFWAIFCHFCPRPAWGGFPFRFPFFFHFRFLAVFHAIPAQQDPNWSASKTRYTPVKRDRTAIRSLLNQGLVHTRIWRRKWKCPFPRLSAYFCSFEGSRAISKPAPNPGTHQTLVETLSETTSISLNFPFWKTSNEIHVWKTRLAWILVTNFRCRSCVFSLGFWALLQMSEVKNYDKRKLFGPDTGPEKLQQRSLFPDPLKFMLGPYYIKHREFLT